jgi:hypothetical protein
MYKIEKETNGTPETTRTRKRGQKEHVRAIHPLYNAKLATAYAWNSSAQR